MRVPTANTVYICSWWWWEESKEKTPSALLAACVVRGDETDPESLVFDTNPSKLDFSRNQVIRHVYYSVLVDEEIGVENSTVSERQPAQRMAIESLI